MNNWTKAFFVSIWYVFLTALAVSVVMGILVGVAAVLMQFIDPFFVPAIIIGFIVFIVVLASVKEELDRADKESKWN